MIVFSKNMFNLVVYILVCEYIKYIMWYHMHISLFIYGKVSGYVCTYEIETVYLYNLRLAW